MVNYIPTLLRELEGHRRRATAHVISERLPTEPYDIASDNVTPDLCMLNEVKGDKSTGLSEASTVGRDTVPYTHFRAHETGSNLVCRLLLEKKNSFYIILYLNIYLPHLYTTLLTPTTH